MHDYALDPAKLIERYGSAEALRRAFEAIRPAHNRLLVDSQTFEQQPVVVSEFGSLSIKPAEDENWYGYATTKNAQELLVLNGALVAGPCWTAPESRASATHSSPTPSRRTTACY